MVPGYKITTPAEELIPGCMCKIKGFEKYLAKVVASGGYDDMNKRLDSIEHRSEDETEPPKKKPKVDKENKTKRGRPPKKHTPNKIKKKGKF